MVHVENSNKHLQTPWIRKAIFFPPELLNNQKVIEDIFLSIVPAISIFTTVILAEHFFSFRYHVIHVDLSQYLHQNTILLYIHNIYNKKYIYYIIQCCDTVYSYHEGLMHVATAGYFLSKLLFSIWCHLSVGHNTVLGMVAQVGCRFCSTSLIRVLQCSLYSGMQYCSCSSLLPKDTSQIPCKQI